VHSLRDIIEHKILIRVCMERCRQYIVKMMSIDYNLLTYISSISY